MILDEDIRSRLRRLRRDENGDWSIETGGKAPHKPLMLLAVMDLIEAGLITKNVIPYDDRLLAAFDLYWRRCCGDRPTNPLQPFWHLKGDGIWTLVPLPGCKQALDALMMGRVPAHRTFSRLAAGAQLDERLFAAMQTKEGRSVVRQELIASCFSGGMQEQLAALHDVIVQATRCESALRKRLDVELANLFAGDDSLSGDFTDESRTIAFRSVVVAAYAHTCTVCGACLRTPTGRSAVQAAHIVPFSVCHNNDPRNGLALCPLHHWAFDQGMLAVTDGFQVKIHPYADELPADQQFLSLQGRDLLLPSDPRIRPAAVAITWHRRNVFEKAG